MKKALVLAVLLILLASPAFAGLIDRSFIKPHGGVVATIQEVEDASFEGVFNMGVIFPLYTPGGFNIYGEIGYADINNDVDTLEQSWDTYNGKIIIFAKEPTTQEINFYGFIGGGFVKDPNWDERLGKRSIDGGLGAIFPLIGTKPMLEVGLKRVNDITTCTITLGLLLGVDPKQ